MRTDKNTAWHYATGWGLALFLLILCALPGCDFRPVPEGNNLLFITIDTLRADALGCYGDPGGHTPRIDALAGKSVLFENCVAPMATTTPSHASMLTGIYPRFHGVRWNGDTLDDDFTTVAEIVEERGWDTAAFVAMQALVDRRGLDQGFDRVSPEIDIELDPRRIRGGSEVNALARAWLEERDPERPFFLWLHYFEPHGPYPVTPYAEAQMDVAGYTGLLRDGAEMEELQKRDLLADPGNLLALQALYQGRVRQSDQLVGEMLDLLEGLGIDGSTAVVVAGDHGQLLGETYGKRKPIFGHGRILKEKALHVPLIVRGPDLPAPHRVESRVGLVDLAPTLLELLGLEQRRMGQGFSLLSVLDKRGASPRRYVAEVRVVDPESKKKHPTDRIAVYEEAMKVIFPDHEVYDMTDPSPESRPLSTTDHPGLVERLSPLADTFLNHDARKSRSPDDLSEEEIEQLRALGYLK